MTKKSFPLSQVASMIDAEVVGNPNSLVSRIASLENAVEGDVAFLGDIKHKQHLATTQATAVVLSSEYLKDCNTNALVGDSPLWSYARLAALFLEQPELEEGVHPTVIIGKNCDIHPSVRIAPYCVLGDNVKIGEKSIVHAGCRIGENTTIGSHALLWSNVVLSYNIKIGNHVTIHSGAVIGSDGFGFAQKEKEGAWLKIPQLGGVVIGDYVDIGASTTIDRGAIEDTQIRSGVKLDNQIQIAHNVTIGENTIVAGSAGIAGSAKIGKNCMIGGGANIAGHITLVDGTMIGGVSTVGKSIKEAGIYFSAFHAMSHVQWKKSEARFRQLDNLAKRLIKLEKKSSAKQP